MEGSSSTGPGPGRASIRCVDSRLGRSRRPQANRGIRRAVDSPSSGSAEQWIRRAVDPPSSGSAEDGRRAPGREGACRAAWPSVTQTPTAYVGSASALLRSPLRRPRRSRLRSSPRAARPEARSSRHALLRSAPGASRTSLVALAACRARGDASLGSEGFFLPYVPWEGAWFGRWERRDRATPVARAHVLAQRTTSTVRPIPLPPCVDTKPGREGLHTAAGRAPTSSRVTACEERHDRAARAAGPPRRAAA